MARQGSYHESFLQVASRSESFLLVANRASITRMTAIHRVVLEVSDTAAAERLIAAMGVGDRVGARTSDQPSTGFRGFTVSLVVAQPSDVEALADAAVGAGATVVKPASKSLWRGFWSAEN